ncbi:MAG: hypothetical protein M3Z36_13725, partial [Acidobacteriota bacterium]|nr:hypothetical protein [Acidobacteriota bacterium]
PLDIQYSNASLNAPVIVNRPNVNGPVAINGIVKTGATWLDTSKFSAPADRAFGNVGRGILRGPGLRNFDLSVGGEDTVLKRLKMIRS